MTAHAVEETLEKMEAKIRKNQGPPDDPVAATKWEIGALRQPLPPPMFESVELGHKLTKEQNDAELPGLRSQLLQAHFQLRGQSFPVIVIISGADGAGKGAVVHRLNEWLDPRGVETHAFLDPSDEERARPPYWRFWRAMPGRGRIGIFFRSWYSEPLMNRVYGETKGSDFDAALDRIAAFEQMLVDDGAVLVKLWLHLSKAEQKKALKKLDQDGQITPVDWKHFKMYRRFIQASERTICRTDSGSAPWHLVEATDRRYREFTVGKILLEAIRQRRPETTAKAARAETKAVAKERSVRKPSLSTAGTVLDRVALTQKLTEANYRESARIVPNPPREAMLGGPREETVHGHGLRRLGRRRQRKRHPARDAGNGSAPLSRRRDRRPDG